MVSLATPVYITVRAATNKLGNDIARGLGSSRRGVSRNGEDLGRAFTQGFNRGVDVNAFRRVSNGLRAMVPEADAARAAFQTMVRTGYTLGTALTVVVGGISSVISALGSLIGAAGGAASTVVVLGNAFFALGSGMIAARLALGGVGSALSKLNKQTASTARTTTRTALQAVRDSQAREAAARRIEDAERSLARIVERNRDRIADANQDIIDAQGDLTKAIRAGREELQQLGFDAEDAALNEERAALQLEKARETLARVQDLPPNSRARREAELAYQEAELNYRKAKDANADLAAEQDRLAKTGVNGLDSVIRARERLADAEEKKADVIKDALQDEEDALRDVAEARKNANNVDDRQNAGTAPSVGGGGVGASWDEGLNDAQRRFVLFLNSMKPLVDELKRIASEAFLPRLQQAIQNLADNAYPTIARGIGIVATAMGEAAISLSEIITEQQNLEKLAALFESSGRIIELLGTSLGRVYDILLSILRGAAPMAERFFGFLDEKLSSFASYLNSVEGNNALTQFFADAEYTANLFGQVLGNVFGGIGALIKANIGPGTGGELLLTWIRDATANMGSDGEGLKQFFLDVAQNATKVMDSLGTLTEILGRLGRNQNIGKTFEILEKGAPALENILQATADAGPKLAELVNTIVEIVSAMTDTGAMNVFFDTLNNIFGGVRDFVSDPAVKGFLDFFGRIFAMFSAIGLVLGGVGFGFKVVVGAIQAFLGPLSVITGLWGKLNVALRPAGPLMTVIGKVVGGVYSVFSKLGGFFVSLASKVLPLLMGGLRALFGLMMANPIGLIITAVSALVGALVWFFTQTEIGKEIWANFMQFLGEAWENISKFFVDSFKNISKFFNDTWTNISNFFINTWNGISSFFSGLWDGIVAIVQGAIDWLVDMFLNWTIYGIIIQNWDAIVAFFDQVWKNIMGFFDAAFKWIDTYVIQPFNRAMQALGKAFDVVGKFIGDVWKNIQNAINAVWKWIDANIFKPIRDAVDFLALGFQVAGQMIDKSWNDMKNALNVVWRWIDDNVFGPIKKAVDLVQDAFENTVKGIEKAWAGIKKAAAVPINFVIDTVYNNGLRSFWNDIADNLNMKNLKLPKASTVKFASGGVLPGYSPGRDIHKFFSPTGGYLHLSGGEAIMRPEWTRMMGGPAAIARMNRAAMKGQAFASGGVFNGGRTQRFAGGGIVDFAGDVWDNILNVGKIIGDFFSNPIKAVETHLINGVIKPLLGGGGDSMFEKLVGGVPIGIAKGIGDAVAAFFKANPASGPTGAGMGWKAMQDIVLANIPGARITSGYRSPQGNASVGGAKGSYHMRGRAIDIVPATMAMFNAVKNLFPNASELIYSPAGNAQLLNGRPFNGWSDRVRKQHYNHVHLAMAKGGTVYPSPDGTIVRVAEAGKPERVEPLDPNGLSDRDKALIDHLTNGGGGTTINVYQQPGEDGEALAQRISRLISRDMRLGAVG